MFSLRGVCCVVGLIFDEALQLTVRVQVEPGWERQAVELWPVWMWPVLKKENN